MLRILLGEALRYHQAAKGDTLCPDEWGRLHQQIEEAWDLSDLPVSERYLRLKYRLTTLFLWDRDHDFVRDLDEPPTSIMHLYSRDQQRRLEALPPGQLFHSPESDRGHDRASRDDYPRVVLRL